MKQFEIIDSFGDTVVVEPELGLYTVYDFVENKMPGLAIQLYSNDEDGFREPYATLTVNLGEFFGMKDCAFIDTNNNSFTAQLLDKGFCKDTGLTKQSGFCTYPLWKFDKDFLKAIDVHGLYETYEKKMDKYLQEGPDLPVEDRADKILGDVLSSLGVEDIELWFAVENGEVEASRNSEKWVGAEFYRYLLAEVCEYNENGAVKGLELDLCNDFYDLCVHNGVDFHNYNKKMEFKVGDLYQSDGDVIIITEITDTGVYFDDVMFHEDKPPTAYGNPSFLSFEEARASVMNSIKLDSHVEKNDIQTEREVSLDSKLVDATERSAESANNDFSKDDFVKE